MKAKFLGHSGFQFDDLVIDPFLSGNPVATAQPTDIKCSIVCLTHDHADHLGDSYSIAKNNNATFVSIFELVEIASNEGIKGEGMNIGGKITVGNWSIKMTFATHTAYTGNPVGFILTHIPSNTTIYHAGDTGLFGDMKLIGDEGIDIAILPIGDRFTMGIEDAAKAADLIQPKMVIPMHYNTFPLIEVDVEEFKELCNFPVEVFHINEEKNI